MDPFRYGNRIAERLALGIVVAVIWAMGKGVMWVWGWLSSLF